MGKLAPPDNVLYPQLLIRMVGVGVSVLEEFVLAFPTGAAHNEGMKIQCVVQNGVVVLPPGVTLADGTIVVLQCSQEQVSVEPRPRKRAQFPLVPSKNPGSLHLTNDMIAEFLNETEISR